MKKQIPDVLKNGLQEAATAYSNSKATTNAGVVLRLIARIIPVNLVLQLFAHKLKKK